MDHSISTYYGLCHYAMYYHRMPCPSWLNYMFILFNRSLSWTLIIVHVVHLNLASCRHVMMFLLLLLYSIVSCLVQTRGPYKKQVKL